MFITDRRAVSTHRPFPEEEEEGGVLLEEWNDKQAGTDIKRPPRDYRSPLSVLCEKSPQREGVVGQSRSGDVIEQSREEGDEGNPVTSCCWRDLERFGD